MSLPNGAAQPAPAITVTIYTTGPACMACRQTKRHLEKHGIQYTEILLDEYSRDAAVFLGLSTAPVVCVTTPNGDRYWDGYRPDRIDEIALETK